MKMAGKKFQVWQVYYPTDIPIPINHFEYRNTINAVLHHYDPTRFGDSIKKHGRYGPQYGACHRPVNGIRPVKT